MNKKLLAVAVVGALASPLAFAQTTTIYGGVDVGYQNASGYSADSANHNFIQSGQDYTSRWGLKGSDDLAPGLTAVYVLEAQINADVGTANAAFWDRQAYAGLDSKQFGALTFGRQYSHMFNQAGQGWWSTLTAAGGNNPAGFGGPAATQHVRISNYAKYSSPKFSGFSIGAGWSPGATSEPTVGSSDDGRYWDAQVSWAQGPISVAFAHNNEKASSATVTGELKRNQFTAHWDNGAFGIFGGYAKDTASGSADLPDGLGATTVSGEIEVKRYWVQPLVRFAGNNEVFGILGRQKVEGGGADLKTSWLGIAGRHYMTKRTWLYAAWATAKNDDGIVGAPTTFAVASPEAGQDPKSLQLGMATTF